MDFISIILLTLSVILSVGRNLFSKDISGFSFGTKSFYLVQAVTFFCGSLALIIFGGFSGVSISALTAFYAIIYGVLLLSAQWCYTAALKTGTTGVCSTVYSLGFILPTISGSLFWNEKITLLNILGVLCVIPAIIISGTKSSAKGSTQNNKYIIPLLIAMLSSGGLGIMQKIQQNSPYPEQKAAFVLIAFVFAAALSLIFYIFTKAKESSVLPKKLLSASGIGICFGCCNLLNTTLAGRLDSAVFFPMQNISVILLSLVFGILIYKEKIHKKELVVLLLGILSILLLNI